MGGEGTSVPDWSEANLCLGYPAPKISRLACIVARPLAKLEEDTPELMVDNILRSTTNLYNQVAATIFSPRSTDDGHNEGGAACRQGRLASSAGADRERLQLLPWKQHCSSRPGYWLELHRAIRRPFLVVCSAGVIAG
jgi:hypothetical protein